jgi:ubiquitin C
MATKNDFNSPTRTPKKKLVSHGVNKNSRPNNLCIMSPTYTPKGWQNKRIFLVYQRLKQDIAAAGDGGDKITNVPGKNQGVWTEGYVAAANPQEVWVFDNDDTPQDLLLDVPSVSPVRKATTATKVSDDDDIMKSPPRTPKKEQQHHGTSHQHIHGVWGYKPGGDPDDPNDVWFYPPDYGVVDGSDSSGSKKPLPRFFTPRGVWTFPLVKNNVSEIAPETTGWLGLVASPKIEKLDVGGTWKMLYKQGGLDDGDDGDDVVKGPGMKSKSPKSKSRSPLKSPKKKKIIEIIVETPDGKHVPVSVFPADTIGMVKDKVEDTEGIPKSAQRMLPPRDKRDLDRPSSAQPLLPDSQTLRDCGIKNGDILRLQGMQVYIKNNFNPSSKSPSFNVDVTNDETTVGELKSMIEQQEGIGADDQLMSFNKQGLDDDGMKLRDYRIQHGDALHLDAWEVIIHDPCTGNEFVVSVHPNDAISKVQSTIEAQEGIPRDYVKLSYNGDPLDQPRKTLGECLIRPMARLKLRPIALTVERPRGKNPIQLTGLSPNDTLFDVKKRIEEKIGVPVDDQRLIMDGKPVEVDGLSTLNDKMLQDLKWHHGDVLQLDGMELDVKHWNGKKTYKIKDIDPTSDTAEDLKRMLDEQHGIPKEHQRLSYQNRVLDLGGKTIGEYSIPHRATLKLEPSQIVVVTTGGESIPLAVDLGKDTLKDVRKRIVKHCDIPINEQRFTFHDEYLDDTRNPSEPLLAYGLEHDSILHLQDTVVFVENEPTGVSFPLVVNLSDALSTLKDAIERHPDGLPKASQNLMSNGKSFDSKHDGRTLRECKINHNDILVLGDIEVNIQLLDGCTMPVQVSPNATIGDVKQKIKEAKGIPLNSQRLASQDGDILNENRKTLQEYGIPHKSTLSMQPMQVNVEMPDGEVVAVPVSPEDKIMDVKNKLEEKEGIPAAGQQLLWNGKELKNPKTLSHYGINDGTTLNLGGMQIYIHHFNGNTLTLPVATTNTLLDVKRMVHTSEKTPIDEQNVVFGGTLLCYDSRTLGEYKIKNGSTLKLEPMKVYVQTSSGKFPLMVEPTLTILGLKDKVQEKTKTSPKDQNLSHRGKDLDNDKSTLKQYQIQHRDVIELDVKDQPTYTVTLGEYQSAFDFVPSPRKKREGVRARKTYSTLGDFHSTVPGNEVGKFDHKTT